MAAFLVAVVREHRHAGPVPGEVGQPLAGARARRSPRLDTCLDRKCCPVRGPCAPHKDRDAIGVSFSTPGRANWGDGGKVAESPRCRGRGGRGRAEPVVRASARAVPVGDRPRRRGVRRHRGRVPDDAGVVRREGRASCAMQLPESGAAGDQPEVTRAHDLAKRLWTCGDPSAPGPGPFRSPIDRGTVSMWPPSGRRLETSVTMMCSAGMFPGPCGRLMRKGLEARAAFPMPAATAANGMQAETNS